MRSGTEEALSLNGTSTPFRIGGGSMSELRERLEVLTLTLEDLLDRL